MSANLFTDNLEALKNDELFAAIAELANDQPNEGWRHEFIEKWDDSSLKEVAAFANTFGGLLIVGVKKGPKDIACELLGVESATEYKTRIASAIAANISPVPSYSVFECHKPELPARKLCVVRIRAGKALHLITKKEIAPLYVRNEDEARPANADQIRRLIDRERDAPVVLEKMNQRATNMLVNLFVNQGYQDKNSRTWQLSPSQPSRTFLRLAMIPGEETGLELEKSQEDRLQNLVRGLYRRVGQTVIPDVAGEAHGRSTSHYEYIWYHKNIDYENRWRITAMGDIGHATQMKSPSLATEKACWSVVDLADYIILFARLNMKWWEYIGYLGEGQLHVHLHVPDLDVRRSPDGHFTGAFDPKYHPGVSVLDPKYVPEPDIHRLSIPSDAILLSPSAVDVGGATIHTSYFTESESLPRLTTSVLNQLLRSLGHVVIWDRLQRSIERLVGN
jgi:hypothetical protein